MGELTHGMNIEQVEELGRFLQQQGRNLEQLVSGIDGKVRSSSWSGGDADRFRGDWWPKHKAQLAFLAREIDGLGQSALNNASAQAEASGGADVSRDVRNWRYGTSDGLPSHLSLDGILSFEADGSPTRPRQLPASETEKLLSYIESAKGIETLRSLGFVGEDISQIEKLLREGGVVGGKNLPILGAAVAGALGGADMAVTRELYGGTDARAMWSQVDAFAGVVLTVVPGGGLAWTVSTTLTQEAAEAVGIDDYGASTYDWARDRVAGGSFQALSKEEQWAVMEKMNGRYEGWSGLLNAASDTMDRWFAPVDRLFRR